MNRSAHAHRAGVRAALVVLMALVAVFSTPTGAAAVSPPGAEPSPASAPADPPGEAQQDVCETEQPPPGRAERRHARTCVRPAADGADAGTPCTCLRQTAVPMAPLRPRPSSRSVVLRC
ncbi:hypothetical protein ACFU5O_05985 [Streptomyces sp. NPDC057445]|uniref:hypothetical protein n=1 Tax=Streptomyces sp. NPDC057445 TaxID=3346136 RepID=UPI0036CB4BDF